MRSTDNHPLGPTGSRSTHVDVEPTSEGSHVEASRSRESYSLLDLVKDLCREVEVCQGRPIWTAWTTFFSPRFRLLMLYRVARFAVLNHLGFLYPPLRRLQYAYTSSEISPYSRVGYRVRLPHPAGIVIGFGAVVEDDVCLFQHVTLGARGGSTGRGDYPVIRSGATLYAGATVIGGVTVGKGSMVGANALVLEDVPDHAVAVGAPAHVMEQ